MKDMNGVELNSGDKIVYETHGGSFNGLQEGVVEEAGLYTIRVRRTIRGRSCSPRVTLRRSAGVLRIS